MTTKLGFVAAETEALLDATNPNTKHTTAIIRKTRTVIGPPVIKTHCTVPPYESTTARKKFLMGLVTQADADGAADLARNVSGVTRVVKVFEYLN